MIVVTGGSGKLGRVCVQDLLDHKYQVLNLDTAPPRETSAAMFCKVDVTDYGQVIEALAGNDERGGKVEGIVHLAAVPAPGLTSNHATFAINMVSTYNVFEAARQLGIRNIVWASSETVYGIPYPKGPAYVPVDEEIQHPETSYSLSKMLGEEMAKQYCRWDRRLKIVGLRFSNVMEPHDYERFAGFQKDAKLRFWNLWTYIDARDGAQAIRLALEAKIIGAEVFGIANADSVMEKTNDEMLAKVFPKAKRKRPIKDNESLISIEKAQRVLGYKPKYSWRKLAKKA